MYETILVVEDEECIRELFCDELMDNHYKVITAKDGAETLKIIEEKMPDLIILDIKLPDITGTEILANIRQYNAELPVIICTAVLPPKLRTFFYRWANAIITKPVDLNLLLRKVKELLDAYEIIKP